MFLNNLPKYFKSIKVLLATKQHIINKAIFSRYFKNATSSDLELQQQFQSAQQFAQGRLTL